MTDGSVSRLAPSGALDAGQQDLLPVWRVQVPSHSYVLGAQLISHERFMSGLGVRSGLAAAAAVARRDVRGGSAAQLAFPDHRGCWRRLDREW